MQVGGLLRPVSEPALQVAQEPLGIFFKRFRNVVSNHSLSFWLREFGDSGPQGLDEQPQSLKMIEFPSPRTSCPMSFGWLSFPLWMISKCFLSLNLLWLFYLSRIFIGPTLIFTLSVFMSLTHKGTGRCPGKYGPQPETHFPRAPVFFAEQAVCKQLHSHYGYQQGE